MFTSEQSRTVTFRGRKRIIERTGLLCFAWGLSRPEVARWTPKPEKAQWPSDGAAAPVAM